MENAIGDRNSVRSRDRIAYATASRLAVPVAAIASFLIALIGCSDTEPQATDDEPQIFELAIEKRNLTTSGDTIRVLQGQQVEIRWQADEGATVHLHGYDISASLKPGSPAVWNFEADATGRFPIEAHGFADDQAVQPQHADHQDHGDPHEHSKPSDEESSDRASSAGGATDKTLLYLEVHPR